MSCLSSTLSPAIIASKSTKRPGSRLKNHPFYAQPPLSYTLPLSQRRLLPMQAAQTNYSLIKGFGGKMNRRDLPGMSLSRFLDDKAQADEKFQCQWAKEGNVAENENVYLSFVKDAWSAKPKSNSSKKKSGKPWAARWRGKPDPILGPFFRGLRIRFVFSIKRVFGGLFFLDRPCHANSQGRLCGKLRTKIYAVIVGASFCIVVAFFSLALSKQARLGHTVVPYSNLVGSIRDGSVIQVQFVENSSVIYYNTKPAAEQDVETFGQTGLLKAFEPKWKFCTRNVGDDKHQLIKMLKDQDVEGVDSAKAELREIVLCINEDSKYMKLGAKLPRGVLLAGPPGTGKTLLARAVAGEAGVSFFSISASELVEIFVGTGAARVRDIFREARKHSPSIIFIDEIDAVGGKRGRTLNCERDQTLNQLLTEMDGFEKDASVVVIAATNRPETLDSALMRPGRFSRKVLVGEPDEDGRQKIFSLYLREVPMEEDKEAISSLVASRTPGLVGADLENIAHESVLLAARRDGDFVTSDDVLQAVERATKKIYDDDNSSEPYSFGPMAQAPAQHGGGAMGFGFN
ncbi:hypothetical protein R6Q57_026571 [Mikania cordata]